jgi:hypothetical protein
LYDWGDGRGPSYTVSREEHQQAVAAEAERRAELDRQNNATIARAHVEMDKHNKDLKVPCAEVTEQQILAAPLYDPYGPRRVRLLEILTPLRQRWPGAACQGRAVASTADTSGTTITGIITFVVRADVNGDLEVSLVYHFEH